MKFFKSNKFKILVSCVLIGVGVFILRFVPGAALLPSFVDFISIPMQEISNKVVDSASDVVKTSEKTADEYEKEIEKLKAENRRMRTIMIDYYDMKRENAQYLKFYSLKKQNKSLYFKMATVVSRDPNELFYGFTLDKGKSEGINVDDPVITENGLIGRVYSVTANSCKVKSILSPDFKMGVFNTATLDSGVISGKKSLADDNLTAMMYISSQNKMNEDDIVVTSGLGGMCPKGMAVGKVKEIKQDDYDSSFYAVIEPFDDVRNIIDVFVVTGFSGKGDIVTEALS